MTGVLVHEWLAPRGGSENVFEELGRIFPDAERFCLWNASEGRFTDVGETWLARTPLRGRKAAALPLMPLAWRQLPETDAEWVLCSSHLFAHHARFRGPAHSAPKLVYAHTPARYVWVPELDGRGGGAGARAVSRALKPLDRKRAQEPVAIAANSRFVAQRIADTWERDSVVIYPPVAVDRFQRPPELSASDASRLDTLPGQFLLGVSRFVPYKQLERVIDAGVAAGLPVVLAGSGPDEARLRSIGETRHPGSVFFVDHPSTDLLNALYRRALSVVFAPIEDFGIIPVESMAAGTPVIANAVGGAAESVIDGETGAIIASWTPEELLAGVERATASRPERCVERATEFGADVFHERIRSWMQESLS
ncbi:glycosyltransferase [Microbacterium sp. SORGH_AS_0862]|uniref:glycosyltransferase n=1 Tax=Microbacterium sp. SORGH_AS_0862 TaxID=3041789 RepID=UPI00279236EC|nr:glycosyltransferase [Microbacterium sp. SORGH_AS_0862]MDQ1205648.1 glycosyltransferase involved in cell wall biosynthesis [Microbacterium sp. SORGH_AS_0862]